MRRCSAREFSEFNRLLAVIVERGLPLHEGLGLVAAQTRSARFRRVLEAVSTSLREGVALPLALRGHPEVFSPEYCGWVELGLRHGRLRDVLRQAETYYALLAQVHRRFVNVLAYLAPTMLLCVGAVILGVTIAGAIGWPLQYTGVEMPLPTRTLIWIAEHPVASLLLCVALPVAGFGVFQGLRRLALLARFEYLIPGWGRVQRSRDVSFFCSAMSLGTSGASALPECLGAAMGSLRNPHARLVVSRVAQRVRDGEPLSSALYYEEFFPRTLSWAVSLAEVRGDLPLVFDTFARIHGAEMERGFEVILLLLTPIGLIAVGNFLLFLLFGLFGPIFRFSSALSKW